MGLGGPRSWSSSSEEVFCLRRSSASRGTPGTGCVEAAAPEVDIVKRDDGGETNTGLLHRTGIPDGFATNADFDGSTAGEREELPSEPWRMSRSYLICLPDRTGTA